MKTKIIDFHTHPFKDAGQNICRYKNDLKVESDGIQQVMQELGIGCICGSVIATPPSKNMQWSDVELMNRIALELA